MPRLSVHGQFLEKGTVNMGERCGVSAREPVTYDPGPPSVAPSHTQLSSTVLRVLSCGPEWVGAE